MSERYIKAFPIADIQNCGITRDIINRKTGEKVGQVSVRSINPEIQAQIDKICADARERRNNTSLRHLARHLIENSIFG